MSTGPVPDTLPGLERDTAMHMALVPASTGYKNPSTLTLEEDRNSEALECEATPDGLGPSCDDWEGAWDKRKPTGFGDRRSEFLLAKLCCLIATLQNRE